jgi:hypothetical protein
MDDWEVRPARKPFGGLEAREVADQINANPKRFRLFLRKTGRGVGRDNWYEINPAAVPTLIRQFREWEVARR